MDEKQKGAFVCKTGHAGSHAKAILVLGFFGGTGKQLRKRYDFLATRYTRDILAIVCPSWYIMSESLMGRWVDETMNWFSKEGLLAAVDTIVVLSGGGTVLYYHAVRFISRPETATPVIRRIMWENGPGTITPGEFYRAVVAMMEKKDSPVLRVFLYPFFFAACKVMDLFTDYAGRTRSLPWSVTDLHETVRHESCIANSHDPVMRLTDLQKWVTSTAGSGRKIDLTIIRSGRHLDGHKADPASYINAWDRLFFDE